MLKATLLDSGFIQFWPTKEMMDALDCSLGTLVSAKEVFDSNEAWGIASPAMLSASQEWRHSLPADATPLKRGSWHELACDVVLHDDCHWSIILYASEICHVTHSTLWTAKTPGMTFYRLLKNLKSMFQPKGLWRKRQWTSTQEGRGWK